MHYQTILFLTVLGFVISCYAYWVGRRLAANPRFKAVCDINDMVSCTKPMRSPYGKLLPVSYAALGVVYYALLFVLEITGAQQLLLIATILGAVCSVGLAYLLYFKIRSLCILCTSLYIINLCLLFLAWKGDLWFHQ